jgi:hypothetical protein
MTYYLFLYIKKVLFYVPTTFHLLVQLISLTNSSYSLQVISEPGASQGRDGAVRGVGADWQGFIRLGAPGAAQG